MPKIELIQLPTTNIHQNLGNEEGNKGKTANSPCRKKTNCWHPNGIKVIQILLWKGRPYKSG